MISQKFISSLDKFRDEVESDTIKEQSKAKSEIPLDGYFAWYNKSYTARVPKIEHKTDYNDGMLKRISNISTMKYGILPNMLHGNTVVFKLYDIPSRKETNYAILFCENIADMPDRLEKNVGSAQIIGNIAMQYYSISASLISCDGEYRTRFNKYKMALKAKAEQPEIWNELDSFVTKIVERRQWNIYASYFHGNESENNLELEKVIRSNLIPQFMLTLTWFHTIYNEYLGLTESHMNQTFKDIFFQHIKVDLEFIKELIKRYGEEELEKFRVHTSHYVNPILGSDTATRKIPLGYKMIPLNMREVQYPLNLKYKPWREHLISSKCNDLVINQIAPGFPITLDWFLIKKSSKGLFDNKSQYERLKHSELAKSILGLLYEAQRSTYFATSDFGKTHKSSEHVRQWISTKFKRLSDRIKDPIEYSIEEIIMSDITLAFPSEFVGRTFADSVQLIKKSKMYDVKIGKPFTNEGYDIFAKYMFEICYNLLAANKRLGVIHGDFHLNNATIGFLYSSENPDAKVVYDVDSTKYVFPNNGYFSCIIDFSRAMINPESYEILADPSSGFKPILDYNKFAAAEVTNILQWYLQLFPNKVKQKEELLVLFKNNFNAVFKLLTCMDLYMFTLRMGSLLQQEFPVSKKAMGLLDKINKLSETYIATEMNHLLHDESYAKVIEGREFPIASIIKKCFPEYINGAAYKKIGVVTDYYVLDNELLHSLSKYATFPDVLKYSRYLDNKGQEVDIQIVNQTRKDTLETYEKRKQHSLEHLKFLAHKYLEYT